MFGDNLGDENLPALCDGEHPDLEIAPVERLADDSGHRVLVVHDLGEPDGRLDVEPSSSEIGRIA
jgi:hypothetical protein